MISETTHLEEKLIPIEVSGDVHCIYCVACRSTHALPAATMTGNISHPSYPGQHVGKESPRCEFSITEGIISYGVKSEHAYAGDSLPLPPVPEG